MIVLETIAVAFAMFSAIPVPSRYGDPKTCGMPCARCP